MYKRQVDIDSAGVLTLDSGAAINIEPASGSAILLDGTISVDAGVVTGATSITSTAFVGDITGDVTGTADTATVATTVTITDNESTDESNAIIFTAGGDVDGGNIGLESDGTLTYNPSTGKVTATGFVADTAVFVGDTANGKMTQGLTLNQGAADNEIFALKSSDINHGMTDQAETDTYAAFAKGSGANGGLWMECLADGSSVYALLIQATPQSANTVKSTSSQGPIALDCAIADGTGRQSTSSNGNLVVIRDAGTARFVFDVEGSAHADVEWVAYAEHDDIALMQSFEDYATTRRLTPERYGKNPLAYNANYFEESGIVGQDSWHTETRPDGRVQERQMVDFTKLSMLHHGAILQVADRMAELEDKLALAESKLAAIGVGDG